MDCDSEIKRELRQLKEIPAPPEMHDFANCFAGLHGIIESAGLLSRRVKTDSLLTLDVFMPWRHDKIRLRCHVDYTDDRKNYSLAVEQYMNDELDMMLPREAAKRVYDLEQKMSSFLAGQTVR